MWRAEGKLLGGHALGAGTEVVEAGLADAAYLGQGGQRVDLGEGGVEGRLAAGLPGLLPRPAVGVAEDDARRLVGVQRDGGPHARAYAAAVSAAQREPARSQPTWTTVVTPTDAALARASSTVPDCMSRWVCESATGTRRGSGAAAERSFLAALSACSSRFPDCAAAVVAAVCAMSAIRK